MDTRQLSPARVFLSAAIFWATLPITLGQDSSCLAPWASGYDWVRICEGESLTGGVVGTGRGLQDGELYAARSVEGEPGKLNLDKGKMNKIWTHSAGAGICADLLSLNPGVNFEWVAYKKGDQIPEGAVLAGETGTDGKVFMGRNKYSKIHGSVGGKINTDAGHLHNLWIHGHVMAFTEGEVLVVKKPEAQYNCDVPLMGYEFSRVCRGDMMRGGAVLGAHTSSDFDIYVGRSLSGEPGKINLDGGKMYSFWSHSAGQSSCAEQLVTHSGWTLEWVPYSKGDAVPDGAVKAGETGKDGVVFFGRNVYSNVYGSSIGKINVDNGRLYNLWIHGYMTAWKEGEVLVMRKRSGKWNPNAMCDGVRAEERAQYLEKDQGMSLDAARNKIMEEFPSQFGGGSDGRAAWNPDAMCEGSRAQERAEWLTKNDGMSMDAARSQVMREFPAQFR